MVDYCTQSDVQENMKGFELDASSKVTPAVLANIISQESSVIDQHLLPRYDLPLTDATALLFVKKICIDLAVYRVTKILQPQFSVQTLDGPKMQKISLAGAFKVAMKMLMDIKLGNSTLPGEDPKSLSMVSSTAEECDHKTNFEYEKQQW